MHIEDRLAKLEADVAALKGDVERTCREATPKQDKPYCVAPKDPNGFSRGCGGVYRVTSGTSDPDAIDPAAIRRKAFEEAVKIVKQQNTTLSGARDICDAARMAREQAVYALRRAGGLDQ
jgi:hypothetical protein